MLKKLLPKTCTDARDLNRAVWLVGCVWKFMVQKICGCILFSAASFQSVFYLFIFTVSLLAIRLPCFNKLELRVCHPYWSSVCYHGVSYDILLLVWSWRPSVTLWWNKICYI